MEISHVGDCDSPVEFIGQMVGGGGEGNYDTVFKAEYSLCLDRMVFIIF